MKTNMRMMTIKMNMTTQMSTITKMAMMTRKIMPITAMKPTPMAGLIQGMHPFGLVRLQQHCPITTLKTPEPMRRMHRPFSNRWPISKQS